MKTVTVSKKNLIEKILENRDTHIKEYLEMMEAFKKDVEQKTKAMLEFNTKAINNLKTRISCIEPVSNEKDYNMALSMLAMSVDDTIELTEQEYKQYVLDEWSWASRFEMSKSAYLTS